MTPSDDPKLPHVSDKNPIPDLAKAVMKGYHFARDEGDGLYYYQDGVYKPSGEKIVEILTAKLLMASGSKVSWVTQRGKEAAALIRIMAPLLWDRPPLDYLNLANGILDLSTRELRPHSPAFLSATQLPVIYDPEAKSIAWRQFLSEVLPPDSQELMWEVMAWLMVPNTSIQKALLLLGGRGTGKSTLLRAIRAFIGEQNVVSISLHMLERSRFHTARLLGKLICMCADLPTEEITSLPVFKAITGGDPVPAEYKMGKIFDILPYARLAFSANEPPTSGERSGADVERWLPVRMERQFENNPEKTKRLDAALADPRELSGVLNEALRVMEKVTRDGITVTQTVEQGLNQLRAAVNPAIDWVSTNLLADDFGFVPCSDIYQAILAELPITLTALGETLNRAFPNSRVMKRTVDGVVRWVRLGVRWNKSETIQ